MRIAPLYCRRKKYWLPGCPRPLASWSPHTGFEFEINVQHSSCLQVDWVVSCTWVPVIVLCHSFLSSNDQYDPQLFHSQAYVRTDSSFLLSIVASRINPSIKVFYYTHECQALGKCQALSSVDNDLMLTCILSDKAFFSHLPRISPRVSSSKCLSRANTPLKQLRMLWRCGEIGRLSWVAVFGGRWEEPLCFLKEISVVGLSSSIGIFEASSGLRNWDECSVLSISK